MGDNNVEQAIRLAKNERMSKTQLSDGALPISPVTTGKNWISEIDFRIPKDYTKVKIDQDIPGNSTVIVITGSIMNKLYRTGTIYSHGLSAIGLWMTNTKPIGQVNITAYWMIDPGGAPPYTIVDFLNWSPIPFYSADIDRNEEVILQLPSDKVINLPAAPYGIALIFEPGINYLHTDPTFLGTQEDAGTEILLYQADIDLVAMTIGAVQYNPYPHKPAIRLYRNLERGIRIAGPEGEIIKPGIPFNNRVHTDLQFEGVDSEVKGEIVFDEVCGMPGSPTAGRIQSVQLVFGDLAAGAEYNYFMIKLSPHLFDYPGSNYEMFFDDLRIEKQLGAANVSVDYLEMVGGYKNKGIRKGMFLIRDPGGVNEAIGYIFRVEECLDMVGAALTVVTRVWAIDVQTKAILIWNAGDAAALTLVPQIDIGPPPEKWYASYVWDHLNRPYQTTTDPPVPPSPDPTFRYVIKYRIWAMGGDVDTDLQAWLTVQLEEDNRIMQTNPAASLSGSESISKQW